MSKKVHANVCALFLQPGVSTMDEILEEAAEDAEAAVESAQQHSSEDIVNVSLLLLPSPLNPNLWSLTRCPLTALCLLHRHLVY